MRIEFAPSTEHRKRIWKLSVYGRCTKMGAYGSRQFREHLEALKSNDPGLYALSLEQVPLGDEGARLLSRALHGNRVLRRLCLGHCGISSIGLQSLASALCDGRSVPSRLRRLELVSLKSKASLKCLQVLVIG